MLSRSISKFSGLSARMGKSLRSLSTIQEQLTAQVLANNTGMLDYIVFRSPCNALIMLLSGIHMGARHQWTTWSFEVWGTVDCLVNIYFICLYIICFPMITITSYIDVRSHLRRCRAIPMRVTPKCNNLFLRGNLISVFVFSSDHLQSIFISLFVDLDGRNCVWKGVCAACPKTSNQIEGFQDLDNGRDQHLCYHKRWTAICLW